MIEVKVLGLQGKSHGPEVLSTYSAWREVWLKEYRALGQRELASDSLARQENLVSVFYEGACAGLTAFRTIDLLSPIDRADSWISSWSSEALNEISKRHRKVLVCSAYTVGTSFQGRSYENWPWKQVVALASVLYFRLQNDVDLMLGNMRQSRKTLDVVKSLGAKSVGQALVHNELSELVVFDKNSELLVDIELLQTVQAAFFGRITAELQKTKNSNRKENGNDQFAIQSGFGN